MDRPERRRHRPGRTRLRRTGRPAARSTSRTLPSNFGVRSLARFDPELAAAVPAGLQRSACRTRSVPGIAVTAEWFHSTFKDLIDRNNVALSASDYTAGDGLQPGDSGTVTAYNLAASKASAVRLPRPQRSRPEAHLQRHRDQRQRAGCRSGARLFGGTSTEQTISNCCSAAAQQPEPARVLRSERRTTSRSRRRSSWQAPIPLPWYGITFSGSLQALAGACSEATRFRTACSRPALAGTPPATRRPNGRARTCS